MESQRLETRLGPLAWREQGQGPPLVFFAGALANGDLWRDVVAALAARHRCITIDLPLGAHPWPLAPGADRSAGSLARLLLDCLELLDVQDATVVANDTAGGLLLLSLASGHTALGRIGRLVLTNCESYEHFPPEALAKATAMSRAFPRLARTALRLQQRSARGRRRSLATVTAKGLDEERAESFFGPLRRDPRIAGDLVAAMAGFRPQLLLDAAAAIPRFERPVLLVWGDACPFFPLAHAERLAADFPAATLVRVPGAKTWVPVDAPAAVSGAIAELTGPGGPTGSPPRRGTQPHARTAHRVAP
jgi:pimeloyl-ACP methyl ester carboxylesterase